MPARVCMPCQQRILKVKLKVKLEGRKGRKGRKIFLQSFGASVIPRKKERKKCALGRGVKEIYSCFKGLSSGALAAMHLPTGHRHCRGYKTGDCQR